MKSNIYKSNSKLISFSLACVTLVVTPAFNEDATTIPKLIVLSLFISNLLPFLILNLKSNYIERTYRILLILSFLMLVQCIIVLILSKAPLEQKFFGRPFRLIGFLTFIFIILLFLVSYTLFNESNYQYLLNTLAITGFISSLYAIFQKFGYDFVQWGNTSTLANGPMGLTNFQSAFSAIAVVPTVYVIHKKINNRKLLIFSILASIVFYLVTIYFTASIQGFIGVVVGLTTFLSIFLLFHNKKIAIMFIALCLYPFGLILSGMFGNGYLARYLYKDSVQSRGDFWRSALRMSNDHPFFGVGFDTFPDYYFRYKDQKTANRSWYENADSAHNYFLDISSQMGYPGSLLFLALVVFVFYSFTRYLKKVKTFDPKIVVLFCAWLVVQATTLVNPINISLFAWNMAISGALLRITTPVIKVERMKYISKVGSPLSPIRLFFSLASLVIVLPIYLSDQSYFNAKKNSDINQMIFISNDFPRSSFKFQDLSKNLLLKGDYRSALEVARNATRFNPNHVASWALILINPVASVDERTNARKEVFRLDPLNKQFKDFIIKE